MLCNTSISNSVIIILLVPLCPWNLPVLHSTIISLWQGTIIKILFRYSPIICQTQHHVLAKGQKRENIPQSFLYHWTITIFMRGALQGKMVSFILYYFHSLYYIFFFLHFLMKHRQENHSSICQRNCTTQCHEWMWARRFKLLTGTE